MRNAIHPRAWLSALVVCCLIGTRPLPAQDVKAGDAGEVLGSTKWQVLYLSGRRVTRPVPLPEDSKLRVLTELQFTGPRPGDPFVLGDFSADGVWQVFNGYLEVTGGKNAAMQIARADQFELEGIVHQSGFGGWFLLLGWEEGRGFAVSNVVLRESGSPWFISSFRGGKALEGGTQEFPKFEWKGEQPFRLQVKGGAFSLMVGKRLVFDQQPLEGYAPGAVILGTYDTSYGPRNVKVKSLRIRALKGGEGGN